jgi:hypothetical protein
MSAQYGHPAAQEQGPKTLIAVSLAPITDADLGSPSIQQTQADGGLLKTTGRASDASGICLFF